MKKTKTQFLLFCFCFLFLLVGNAQDGVIHLNNPSFEGIPRPGQQPKGWYDCGDINFPFETPPDVHPIDDDGGRSNFGVTQKSYHGQTYLGMVVRENESWESVSQNLEKPLSPDSCYSFSLYLCKSEIYRSGLRGRKEVVDFTFPIKLRIWGGNAYCDRAELLAESPLVENIEWQNYYFNFQPTEQHDFIILEAYFHTPTITAPNGNIMIDHGSPIILVSCDAAERKNQLAQLEEERNDLDLKIGSTLNSNNPSKKRDNIYQDRDLESQIKVSGPKIKFKSNRITLQGELALRRILGSLLESPNQKLIIDFGGLKEKYFIKRKESLEYVIKNWSAPFDDFEIINSKEENDEVKWVLEKDHFYIGILKKK